MLEIDEHGAARTANGEEAPPLALDHPDEIDLVMIDIVIPKMGGTEFAGELGGWLPALPVHYTARYVVDGLIRSGALAQACFIPKLARRAPAEAARGHCSAAEGRLFSRSCSQMSGSRRRQTER